MPHVGSGGSPSTNGTALQAAVTAAAYGDTITLDPGGIYEADLVFPDKGAGSTWITIEPTGMASFPNRRVTPADLSLMPTLRTGTGFQPIFFNNRAHHYHLRGLHITTSPAVGAALLQNQVLVHGGADSVEVADIPHDIIVDRCLLHPAETDPLPWRSSVRAFSIDGADITITRNYMYDFMGYEPPKPSTTGEDAVPLASAAKITAVTNASPCQVTLSIAHGRPSTHKTLMLLDGGTGVWSALNGLKVCAVTSPTALTLEDYHPVTFALTPINTTSFGAFPGLPTQTIARMSQIFSQSQGILITRGPGPYLIEDNWIEASYTRMFTGGGASTFIPAANTVAVTAVGGIDTVTLSGLGDLQVGDLIAFEHAEPQAVTAASAASPCVLTVATHRYPVNAKIGPEGPGVVCFGAAGTGAEWAFLNTTRHWGKVLSSTTIELYSNEQLTAPIDTTGKGALNGGVTWIPSSKYGGVTPQEWQVGRVTAIAGSVVTYDFAGHPTTGGAGNGAGVPVQNGSAAHFNGIVLHDVMVRRNTFNLRASWHKLFFHLALTSNGNGSGTKGTWETKMGDNVTIEGNIFQVDGPIPDGFDAPGGIGMNQANQSGATPWVTHNNWILRNNVFIGLAIFATTHTEEYESGVQSSGLLIENNVMTKCASNWLQINAMSNMVVRHNTVRANRAEKYGYNAIVAGYGISNSVVTFDSNIMNWAGAGYQLVEGTWTLTTTKNHIIDNQGVSFSPPGTDVRIATEAAMKFVDLAAGDAGDWHGYALASDSPGHLAASDGKDVGADFTQLDIALGEAAPRRGGAFSQRIFRLKRAS